MSSKSDKEKSSGSKMLKKARSFRDDIKTKIKRRPSTGADKMIPESVKAQTPKQKQKQQFNRNSSVPDAAKDLFVGNMDDIDKLHTQLDEMTRTLKFIQAVVNQNKPQMLPPTATHVLETVLDVFTVLNNLLANEDSTALVSSRSKVCQCLARFVRWTDVILVKTDADDNKDNSTEVITALSDGIKELTQLCIEKIERRKQSPSKSSSSLSSNGSESLQRASLPEIPLTPRERHILAKTSDMGLYDNTSISRSHDSLDHPSMFTFDQDTESPPPKPPLPQGVGEILPKLIKNGNNEQPPPIPEKEKRHSSSNLSFTTPTTSPRGSLLNSPSTEFSFNSGVMCSPSPRSSSPMGNSPASSMSSGLNQSTEELAMASSRTFSKQSSVSRVQSSVVVSSKSSCKTVEDINKLTFKINRLTSNIDAVPPPIPNKTRINRLLSTYDNIPFDGTAITVCSSSTSTSSSRTMISRTSTSSSSFESAQNALHSQSMQTLLHSQQNSHSSSSITTDRTSSQETYSSSETFSSTSHSSLESLQKGGQPPPLPPKLKHINNFAVHAYMQMVGSYTQPQAVESISRHSINFYESQWQQHQMELFNYPRSNTISVISDISNFSSDTSFSSGSPDMFLGLPALPVKTRKYMNRQSQGSIISSISDSSASDLRDKTVSLVEPCISQPPSDLDMKRASAPAKVNVEAILPPDPDDSKSETDVPKDSDSAFGEPRPLDDVDVSDQLIRKKEGEDGPSIRGGMVDALVVHATAAGKTGSEGDSVNEEEFIYQEAFLTTYRTFISPKELIEKLLYRFYKFQHATDSKKRLAKNSFSLLIRVIDELGAMELDDEVVKRLMDLVYELLCQSDLVLARILRKKVIEKCEQRDSHQEPTNYGPINQNVSLGSTPILDLLSFKSHDIAEQMTLMDAELFQKIEIPEVLLWAKEQSEELSPHLTFFTEHFNNMSFWCRTRILEQNDAKEREKYLMKFIKIMRHLRKLSNFNSYLAVLSALDSAPVRRLEWQKQNLEALKEFCLLIDSSSSFRAYRQALAETEPPCIPYLGLILQDLTFINIGNQNLLPDGSINFAKRWQLFNILDSMRRFKNCNFDSKKKEPILHYLANFKDHDNEETLWQRSEKIKPRVVRKRVEVD